MSAALLGSPLLRFSFAMTHLWLAQATVEGSVRAPDVSTANAVVFLVADRDTVYDPPDNRPIIDQRNLRFVPSVLVILPGSTVEFRNSDPLMHNVFGPRGPGAGFDLGTYPRNTSRSQTFTELGAHVILCHVHPDMAAYIVVVPTPYHAVVDEDEHFRIVNVQSGKYTINVWHRSRKSFAQPLVIRNTHLVRVRLNLSPAARDAGTARIGELVRP